MATLMCLMHYIAIDLRLRLSLGIAGMTFLCINHSVFFEWEWRRGERAPLPREATAVFLCAQPEEEGKEGKKEEL